MTLRPARLTLGIRQAVATALLTGLIATSGFAATELSGVIAPDFVLKSSSGENLRLSEYRGQVVIVNFWASWCGDCQAQLAELEELKASYADADIQLLSISLDQDRVDASRITDRLGLSFPTLHDAEQLVSKLYDVNSIPVALLIDRDGIVRDIIESSRINHDPAVTTLIDQLLGDW